MSDVTLKVTEPTFGEVFNKIWPALKMPFNELASTDPGIAIGVEGEFHVVKAGDVEFNPSDTFTASEIDIKWDKLILRPGIDLPDIKIGDFCLISMPDNLRFIFGDADCLVMVPGTTLFTAEQDLYVKLDLSPIFDFITTEISTVAKVDVKHIVKPPDPDHWGIFVAPEAVNVDPVDIQDTLGQSDLLVAAAVAAAAKYLYSIVPAAFVIDVLLGVVGFPSVSEYILDILDIQDETEEWLMRTLNIDIGIDQLMYDVILSAILSSTPLYKIKDPVKLLAEKKDKDAADYGGFGPDGNLAPPGPKVTLAEVGVRVKQPQVEFTDDEMIVTFDFGD